MQIPCENLHERNSWQNNVCIAGIDEAGRGPLCGPVVIAGVILPQNTAPDFLIDSKKLSEKRRIAAYSWITSHCIYTTVTVSHTTIDTFNIYQATMAGMRQVYFQLAALCKNQGLPAPAHLVIDAMPLPSPEKDVLVTPIIRGEAASSSIAAASIVAKVTRDSMLAEYAQIFPAYSLTQHKGYGTALHIQALKAHGPSLIHRKSFVVKPKSGLL
jgi:ribonuclease HII